MGRVVFESGLWMGVADGILSICLCVGENISVRKYGGGFTTRQRYHYSKDLIGAALMLFV